MLRTFVIEGNETKTSNESDFEEKFADVICFTYTHRKLEGCNKQLLGETIVGLS